MLASYACVAAEMSAARLYIGRLSDSARDRDVERFFKGYGRLREIVLKNGYGFVVSVLKNNCQFAEIENKFNRSIALYSIEV